MKMFTTVILTASSIGVMVAVGAGVGAVFNWLNTTDLTIGKKSSSSRPGREPGAGSPHGARLDGMKNRMKPSDF